MENTENTDSPVIKTVEEIYKIAIDTANSPFGPMPFDEQTREQLLKLFLETKKRIVELEADIKKNELEVEKTTKDLAEAIKEHLNSLTASFDMYMYEMRSIDSSTIEQEKTAAFEAAQKNLETRRAENNQITNSVSRNCQEHLKICVGTSYSLGNQIDEAIAWFSDQILKLTNCNYQLNMSSLKQEQN